MSVSFAPPRPARRAASLIVSLGSFLLGVLSTPVALAQTKAEIITASQKAVNFIMNDAKAFNANACFSCHNSGQAIRAGLMAEKSLDLTVDQSTLNQLITYVNGQQYAGSGTKNGVAATGAVSHVGNANYLADMPYTTTSWAIYALIGAEKNSPAKPSDTTTPYTTARFLSGAGFVERVIHQYNGIFPVDHQQAPVDTGNPGETARAVAILARARQIDGQAHWTTAIDKAVAYLRNVQPRNSGDLYIQDIGWIIMGLSSAGIPASDPKIASLVTTLKSRRNTANGGWSRYTTATALGASDAFATGVALNALLAIGEKNSPSYPELQAGVRYLLNTQQANGSWPSNISLVSGSTWAVLSLTELAAAPPTLTVPADITAEATSTAGASVSFSVTAVDEIDGTLTPTLTHASGSTFPLGTTQVTASALNTAGITATKSFNVTVVDTTKPVIAVPAELTLEATSPAGAVATFTYSATDNINGSVAVTSTHASGSTFPLGTTIVTLTARDASNNAKTEIFAVIVQDTTAPAIAAQPDVVVEATSAAGAVVSFSPTASDIASSVTVGTSPASGSTFALGTTPVTITATDSRGNVSTATFNVTVRDTIAPVIAAPADITAEATSAAGAAVTFAPTATDAVTANVAVSASRASGSTFALGTTQVTLTATDAAGNSSTATFNVIVKDTIAPVVTAPADQVLEAIGPAGASATFAASATDATGAALAYSHASGSVFALGTTQVTATATDAAGNTASATFKITVRDTTKPALTLPANLTVEATSANGAAATFNVSATDLVTASPALNLSHGSGSTFALGTTTVTVSATDAAGNVATGSFTVTVRDTTAPVIAALANQTLEATSAAGAVATFNASASDAVGVTNVSTSHASGSTFPIGVTTVTVTATDAAGNASSRTFSVTVKDTIAPTFSSLTVSTGSLWPANHKMVAINLTAVATDTVGLQSLKIVSVTSSEPDNGLGDGDTAGDIQVTGPLTLNLRAERAGNGNGRIYTIVVEARDAAGNATTRTVTVSVPKSQGGK